MSAKKEREKRREERLRKETEGEGRRRRKVLLQAASAAVFLAVIAVAVLIVVSQTDTSGGDSELEGVGAVRKGLSGLPQSGLVLGHPDARVTLFEYGDLQCPVCKAFSEKVIPELIDSKVRTGEAKLDFRNFTIINDESTIAGAAAIAAGEQGRGWNFVELYYRNQGIEATGYVTQSFLISIAKGAGVADLGRWNADRKSADVLGVVRRTSAEAERLQFGGTPSFAVEGPATGGIKTLGTPGSAGELEAAIADAG
jgi:protein-disulfide isomerase